MNYKIMNKYELSNIVFACKSNYGIIYRGLSKKFGDVIIKYNKDKENFENSCRYYKEFNKLPLCDLYAFDYNNKIQVLKYINGQKLHEINDFEKRVKLGYNYLYDWSHSIKKTDDNKLSFEIKVYKLLEYFDFVDLPKNAVNLLRNFDSIAKKFFKTYDNSYLLHGDLHHDNLVFNGKHIIAIDLSPQKASFAIEVAKFIENELFNNIDKLDEILNYILNIFKFDIINKEELLEGLFVDSCYRTFDSYKENKNNIEFQKGINMNEYILQYINRR